MQKINFRLGLAALIFLSACHSSPSGAVKTAGGWGISSGSDVSDEAWTPDIAADFNRIEVTVDPMVKRMNHLDTLLSESLDPSDKSKKIVNDMQARKVKISGIRVDLDPQKEPFKSYQESKALSQLLVEAEEIHIKGPVHLPQTRVTLIADHLVIEAGASLDTTPLSDPKDAASFIVLNPTGSNTHLLPEAGSTGEAGAEIQVQTQNLEIQGDLSQPRLIANGGQGQKGGDGKNGADGDHGLPLFPGNAQDASGKMVSGQVIYTEKCLAAGSIWVSGCLPWPANGNCWKTRTGSWDRPYAESGTYLSPEQMNGKDAIASASSGVGGFAGRVQVQTGRLNGDESPFAGNQADWVENHQGLAGEQTADHHGGAAGTPANSVIFACVRYGQEDGHTEPRLFQPRKGAEAPAPQVDSSIRPGPASIVMGQAPTLNRSSDFFRQKLLYIRSLELRRQWESARTELVKDMYRLQTQSIQSVGYGILIARYGVLLQRISRQQDYFGHALNEAPAFSLSFDIGTYRQSVLRAIGSFRLSNLLIHDWNTKQDAAAHLREALDQANQNISQDADQLQDLTSQFGEWDTEFSTLQNQQEALAQTLADLNRHIEERAQQQLQEEADVKNLKDNLRVLASICKVVPAYQPALAAMGSLTEHLLDVPQSSNPLDWAQYLQQMKGDLDTLDNQKNQDQSRQSFNELIDKMNPRQLKGKTWKERADLLSGLYKDLQPSIDKIRALAQGLNQNTVSESELQAKILEIQNSDPLFKKVTDQIQKYLIQKMIVADIIQKITSQFGSTLQDLDDSIALSQIDSNQLVNQAQYQDNTLKNAAEQKEAQSENRLLEIYEEVRRAYQYTALENTNFMPDLGFLRDKVLQITTQDPNANPDQALKDTYDSVINQMLDHLDQKFRADGGPDFTLREDVASVDLSADQLATLNQAQKIPGGDVSGGALELTLDPRNLFQNQYNVRLIEIEAWARFDLKKNSLPTSGTARMQIQVTPGRKGTIVDSKGQSHEFNFPTNDLHGWISSYDFLSGQAVRQTNAYAQQTTGILGLLVGEPNVLARSPIFAETAAITKLRIETLANGYLQVPIPIQKLTLKVKYSYSKKN